MAKVELIVLLASIYLVSNVSFSTSGKFLTFVVLNGMLVYFPCFLPYSHAKQTHTDR